MMTTRKPKAAGHGAPPPHARPGTARGSKHRSGQAKRKTALLVQRELLLSRDYAEAIIEAVPPLLVLDQELRVQTANESFCKCFNISLQETLNRRVYELGNGQWNIPRLRTLLEKVLPEKSFFKDFEVTHTFEAIGRRTMLLSGRQVDSLQRILLFIEDITERVESRAVMRASEIRYRRLFEAARDGILILDPKTRKITDANPFMTELLGYRRKELLGKELWEIGLLKDEAASQAAFRQLQKKHFIRYEDLPLQNKRGERREVEFVSNLYPENGHEVIQCNIRDITERKRTEEALRKSEERYRGLFNSLDEGFCIIEMIFDKKDQPVDYRLLEVNPGFEKQCGLLKAVGKRVRELIPNIEDYWIEIFGKVALTGIPTRFAKQAKALDGRWFDVYAFPLTGAEHHEVAVLFSDITDRRRNEEALLAAKNEIARHAIELEQVVTQRTRELRDTIGELEGFSYSVSHDMRAPLRAMESFAQFLVDEYGSKLDEQAMNYLQQIMRSAVRLDHLIQDVLSYTKIMHANLPLGRVDLDRLVRDIVEVFPNGQPGKPDIRIEGTLPNVMGNEALLAQCVSNLMSNGAKFVSPGTTPHLQVSAQAIGDSIRVWFKDNGIGIAPENHDRIFRLFERIHPETVYEGTGIGLTIVRKAIERMGAQLGFESEVGKGSRFWIQLRKG